MKKNESNIGILFFTKEQASLLHVLSKKITLSGGPDSNSVNSEIDTEIIEFKNMLTVSQNTIIEKYKNQEIPALAFENMEEFSKEISNEKELKKEILENSYDIQYLGSRSQILLKLIEQKAFAYDIDNKAKIVRTVANFNGGGQNKISKELSKVELSSHSGIPLGPHTEAPYNCTFKSKDGLSPSPSSLIISAKYNPGLEPTFVIPILPILERIGIENTLALSLNYFTFTQSDSFTNVENRCEKKKVSILDFNEEEGFSVRYNSYRFSITNDAPLRVKRAYELFCKEVDKNQPEEYVVTNKSAIIINNYRALHSRNVIKHNGRVLVRLFGISNKIEYTMLSNNPLIIKG